MSDKPNKETIFDYSISLTILSFVGLLIVQSFTPDYLNPAGALLFIVFLFFLVFSLIKYLFEH